MNAIAVDLETTGLDPRLDRVRLVQTYDGSTVNIVDAFKEPEALDELVKLFEDPKITKVGQNLAFDMSFCRVHAGRRVRFANLHDTMVCEQVLMAGFYQPYLDKKTNEIKKKMPEYTLAALVKKHLGFVLEKDMQRSNWGAAELTKEQMAYASRDVEVLIPLLDIQRELLEANNLQATAKLEFDTLPAVVEMQVRGMPVDWTDAEVLRGQIQIELYASKKELEDLVRSSQKSRQRTLFGEYEGIDLNLNSPKQVLKYLQEKLGIVGIESSDVEALKSIDHPFAAKLLRFRTLEKHLNFLEQFESFGAKSGRIYPAYNQCRAATGRMSSSRPNGQQIPKRGDGARFRKLFKALPGYKLVKVDFSAIELRVMARLAKDPAMMNAIADGVDLHRLTASNTNGKPIADISKEERQHAKALNFGLIYGMSAPTLKNYAWMSYGVRITDQEAVDARSKYFNLYRGIAKWHEEQKAALRDFRPYHVHNSEKGFHINYVAIQQTLSGRKRFWPNFAGDTMARPNDFYNSADQGTSADITKMALARLYQELPEDVYLIGAVHDEIICETPQEKAQSIADLMLKVMTEVGSEVLYPVKVDAEATIGQTWGD